MLYSHNKLPEEYSEVSFTTNLQFSFVHSYISMYIKFLYTYQYINAYLKSVRTDAVVYFYLRNSVIGYQLFQVSQEHISSSETLPLLTIPALTTSLASS